MEQNVNCLLFSILRSVLRGEQMSESDKGLVTEDVISQLIKRARQHDLSHLVSYGLTKNGLIDEVNLLEYEKITYRAVLRYTKMNHEYEKLCKALEEQKIAFIPLKGSVMRNYYPEPWMRTSCDIDILIHEEDLQRTVSYLTDKMGYVEKERNTHDVSLLSSKEVNVELHYDLMEEGLANSSSKILKDIWKEVCIKEGSEYHYVMPDDIFYFYHVAHMAKHFQGGGCGIRSLIDLWILDNMEEADVNGREALLQEGDLKKYAEKMRKLSRCWFDAAPLDEFDRKVQDYILRGGAFGTMENRIVVQQQKLGGKIGYSLSRIIIPYQEFKFYYPVLQKHPWLTPIMHVRRWFGLVFCGGMKRSVRELTYNKNITSEQAAAMKLFLNEVGL